MPLFNHRFTRYTLDRLIANGVAWQAVLFVLDVAHPVVRQHVGAHIMLVVGADPRGHLLMVTLRETDEDDLYDIETARYLDPEESAAASTQLNDRRTP